MKAFIFALAMWGAVGPTGQQAKVPLVYSLMVFEAAEHHGLDPIELGTLLIVEHRGHYDPNEEGRYGDRTEIGLHQTKPIWAREAYKRCNFKRWYYVGLPGCLWIPRGVRVLRKATPRQLRKGLAVDLRNPRYNVEAAAIGVRSVKRWYRVYNGNNGNWRAGWRCSSYGRQNGTRKCRGNIRGVMRWERRLRERYTDLQVLLLPAS